MQLRMIFRFTSIYVSATQSVVAALETTHFSLNHSDQLTYVLSAAIIGYVNGRCINFMLEYGIKQGSC
jgi:hypothetical protein